MPRYEDRVVIAPSMCHVEVVSVVTSEPCHSVIKCSCYHFGPLCRVTWSIPVQRRRPGTRPFAFTETMTTKFEDHCGDCQRKVIFRVREASLST